MCPVLASRPRTHGGSPHRSWPMPFSPTVCEALRLVSHALCASFIRTIVPNRFTCSRLALPSRCFVPISGTLLVPLIFLHVQSLPRAFRDPLRMCLTLPSPRRDSGMRMKAEIRWLHDQQEKGKGKSNQNLHAQKMIIRTFSVSFELVGKFEFAIWAPRKYFSIRHQFYAFGAYLHKLLFQKRRFFCQLLSVALDHLPVRPHVHLVRGEGRQKNEKQKRRRCGGRVVAEVGRGTHTPHHTFPRRVWITWRKLDMLGPLHNKAQHRLLNTEGPVNPKADLEKQVVWVKITKRIFCKNLDFEKKVLCGMFMFLNVL